MVDTMGRRRGGGHQVPAWLIKLFSPFVALAVPFVWLYYHIPAVVIFWASLVLLFYYLFAAPTICGVVRSDGKRTCDRDAYGVLRACSLQAHKRKKRQRLLHRIRHPLTRPPPVAPAVVHHSRTGHVPVYSYATQPSPRHLETVLSVVEVSISAFALIVSFVAWRFPVV